MSAMPAIRIQTGAGRRSGEPTIAIASIAPRATEIAASFATPAPIILDNPAGLPLTRVLQCIQNALQDARQQLKSIATSNRAHSHSHRIGFCQDKSSLAGVEFEVLAKT